MKAEIRAHFNRLVDLGCMVSQTKVDVTIHYAHGGSMEQIIGPTGMALRASHWLTIPLAARFHTGNCGIDGFIGVETWELMYGTQVMHLNRVCELLGYNVWEKAGIDLGGINGTRIQHRETG